MVRLQKFLADAGVASRRASEQLILEGRVAVHGRVVRELGTRVDPDRDRVTVDGQVVKSQRKLYVALNKPPGYVCSRNDELKRKTVGELLPREWRHLYTIGRLDLESEGLILLTNDGQFSLHVSHPRYGIRKKYLARIRGRVAEQVLGVLTRGVRDQGETLKAEKARLVSVNNTASVVELELAGGKNREVRRLFESQGLEVERLQRFQIGRVKLGELPQGKWRTLTEPEIKSLLSDI